MIHPTAIIDPEAELASDISIGPYSVIGGGVRLGQGTRIGSHVVIHGPCTLGNDNHVHSFASLGDSPQDVGFDDSQHTRLEIGDRNEIREYVSIHRGAAKDDYITRIGSDNLIMAYVHIGHNCQLGNHIVMANSTDLSGHVIIGDYATVGGQTGVHQFCRIGCYAMVGGCSRVPQDILPFMLYAKDTTKSINGVGLKRHGFSADEIRQIRSVYKMIYQSNKGKQAIIESLEALSTTSDTEKLQSSIESLLAAIKSSKRGWGRSY